MGSASRSTRRDSASLYPTHDAYVAQVKDATEKNLKAGFITKADADATIRDAEKSKIGSVDDTPGRRTGPGLLRV